MPVPRVGCRRHDPLLVEVVLDIDMFQRVDYKERETLGTNCPSGPLDVDSYTPSLSQDEIIQDNDH